MRETDDELLERVVGQLPAADESYVLCRRSPRLEVRNTESVLCDSPKRCTEEERCVRNHCSEPMTMCVPASPLGFNIRVSNTVPRGEVWFEQGGRVVAKLTGCDSS